MAIPQKRFGFGQIAGNTTNPLAVYCRGQRRFDIGNAVLTTEGAQSGALLFGLGTSTTHVTTGTASAKFISFYLDDSATSGTSTALYIRSYVSGAAGSTVAGRFFSTVSDVTAATVHGIQSSVSFGTSGKVTGLAAAVTGTVQIANQATQSGTMACFNATIYADGTTSDPSGAAVSFIRCAAEGDTTGDDDIITDAYLFDITNFAAAGGSMYDETASAATGDGTLKIRVNGVAKYLLVADDAS